MLPATSRQEMPQVLEAERQPPQIPRHADFSNPQSRRMPAASGTSNGFESGVSRRQMASFGAPGGTHPLKSSVTTRAGWPSTSEPSPLGRWKDERLVVEAEQVQQRGVVVVVVDDVLDRLVAELVGRAVDVPALEAAAGEPHAEAVGVVVAADVLLVLDRPAAGPSRRPRGRASCRAGRAASGRVTRAAEGWSALRHGAGSAVTMPPWWSQCWLPVKTCTKRTPRSTSRRAIRQRVPNSRGRRVVEAVELAGRGGLAREVERLLGGGLHAGGQLVAGDAGRQVVLAGVLGEVLGG